MVMMTQRELERVNELLSKPDLVYTGAVSHIARVGSRGWSAYSERLATTVRKNDGSGTMEIFDSPMRALAALAEAEL